MDEWLTFIERLPHSWRRVPCAFRINLHLNVLTLQTESRGLERLNYFSVLENAALELEPAFVCLH